MQAFQASIGKRLLQQRKGGSCTGTTCFSPVTSTRNIVTELHVARCASPAASSAACTPADWHYAVPSSITTRAEFEHQYRQHMATPNRYCRYGDIELYAPSEEGAAAILKTVAEPLVRCQRWLRLGNSLIHILLYELLKIFAALGGDRELILAGSDELDALATVKSGSGHGHTSFHVEPYIQTSISRLNAGTSNGNGIRNGDYESHPSVDGHLGGYAAAASNGNGIFATSSNGNGCIAVNNGNATASNNNGAGCLAAANGISSCGNGSSSNGNGNHSNRNGSGSVHHNGYNASGNKTFPPSHAPLPGPGSFSHSSPPSTPGFLLLRTDPRVRDSSLEDLTATGFLAALSAGAASPLLLVEMHDSDGSSSSSNDDIPAGGLNSGLGSQGRTRPSMDGEVAAVAAAGGTTAATAAKYRLWARMMEAALHTRASVPVTTSRVGSRRDRGQVATPVDNGDSGSNGNGNGAAIVEQSRPIVVWGLLTDLKCWRFYCVRETTRQASLNGSNGNGNGSGVGKFEILGSRRLRVADEYMATWPGLVPALAALYAILCTSDGLATQRSGDASQALTYDMPHDPHRDRLMRFHLIMGAPNAPLYGTVGEWVRQRLGEYVQCRHEQKRLRQASEATAQQAAVAVAAARAAAAAAAAATIDRMPPPPPGVPNPAATAVTVAAAATATVADSTLHLLPATPPAAAAPAPAAAASSSTAAPEVAEAAAAPAPPIFVSSRISGTEREPSSSGHDDRADKKGMGSSPAAATIATAAVAAGTTEYYGVRLAAAKQQLVEARERAARLRLHARALGISPQWTPGTGPSEPTHHERKQLAGEGKVEIGLEQQ
ncbi:hypothetical protein Vretimale_7616 [Volvox reticuliferus]|uniref:Uncharacterized protein n=1 Tax=Volvox reticuliferus TaxID=1737510 RepID=A0A8J4G999_9CHLO|nr:hypothetical protein Vretifemale_7688 [Volvox reticuliferus]GIM02783.1 hypothetical protein Vretimale_7616 [Volvox reticuliferus]